MNLYISPLAKPQYAYNSLGSTTISRSFKQLLPQQTIESTSSTEPPNHLAAASSTINHPIQLNEKERPQNRQNKHKKQQR